MRILLVGVLLLLSACQATTGIESGTTPPISAPAIPVTDTGVVLFYVEGQGVEPWSRMGAVTASEFTPAAKKTLEAAGLHPISIDRVPAAKEGAFACAASGCPTLFALKVRFPAPEQTAALAHCFVAEDPAVKGGLVAGKRKDCLPLWVFVP